MLLIAGLACDRSRRPEGPHIGPGVTEIDRAKAEIPAAVGQTIYVPAYSSVPTADNSQMYQLAIVLSVRNTDRSQPIVVTEVRYHDQDGRLARDFLKKPVRIAPLAALEIFVREGDSSGGTSASFLVEWVGEQVVTAPVVESVMVGTVSNQGISFICPGRVIADRAN